MNRVTTRRLADGREITYVDGPDAPPRLAEDTRPLGERVPSGELRWDALVGADVAQQLGFSDARAFRRAYKRWLGEVPGAARRR